MLFLISHTNKRGTGIAQAQIRAKTEANAMRTFHRVMPERVATVIVNRKTAREAH